MLGPRGLPLMLVLVLLFSLGASIPIACCAGVATGAHQQASAAAGHCAGGGSCCERAESNAAARHCCQGGDAFERPQTGPRPMLHAAGAALEAPITIFDESFASTSSLRDPVPRFEPLYTLHSSLLI